MVYYWFKNRSVNFCFSFGFSTYLIIIIGVGHNSKAHAIAYMPLVIAGFIVLGENMFSGVY
jgi:hypothetical protein